MDTNISSWLNASGLAVSCLLAACTCATETEKPLPPPPTAGGQNLQLLPQPIAARDLPKDFRPRAPMRPPKELDERRAARLSPTIQMPKGLGRLRRLQQVRMVLVGQGKLSLKLGDATSSLPARVYRQGNRLVLSAEREDLGVVLVVPSLAAGDYQRGGPPERAPNLRARVGVRGQDEMLQAADEAPNAGFTARLGAVSADGVLTGTFEGQVSRDMGQSVRKVSDGQFEAKLDTKRAEVESWLRLIAAPAAPQ